MVAFFFSFLRKQCTVFRTAVPFCIPTNNAQGFQHQSLTNTSYFLSLLVVVILTGVEWHLIAVLMCISPIISDVEHLFECLLATCYSLEKVYSSPLPSFKLCCFLVEFKGYLYFLDINLLPHMICKYFLPFFCTLFAGSWMHKIFKFS